MGDYYRGTGTGGLARLLLDPALCATVVNSAFREGRLGFARGYGKLPASEFQSTRGKWLIHVVRLLR